MWHRPIPHEDDEKTTTRHEVAFARHKRRLEPPAAPLLGAGYYGLPPWPMDFFCTVMFSFVGKR